MYVTRQAMIDFVNNVFEEYDYKGDISKRLNVRNNTTQLTYNDCISLNDIVKKLDSQMLNEVDFDLFMTIENLDNSICRLLYVMGKWTELCFYQMLINDTSDVFYVNICNNCETHINVFFTTDVANIGMAVDDQKVGIKIATTIKTEKEF